MVFQNYALYPHLTVFDNLAFGLRRRKAPRGQIAERVAWAAELLALDGLLDRKPHALSGGQRQRVALGRAIVRRPAAFLFDEPLSNLDAQLRADTRAELKRLHRKLATTTIYVTHDQEEAMTLGDRIVVMRGGRMQQCGPPLEVYNRPANRFVAGFIGTPTMNFIAGQLHADAGGQRWFESPGLRVPVPDVGWDEVRVPPPAGDVMVGLVPRLTLLSLSGRQECLPQPGEKCVLGVRPENLQLQPPGDAGRQWSISGSVELVEPLGSLMDLHVRVAGDHRLVCRVPVGPIDADNRVTLYMDLAKAHLFVERLTRRSMVAVPRTRRRPLLGW